MGGGFTDPERFVITELRLAHTRLDWAMRSVTAGKAKAPPLQDFIPDMPVEPEPAKPLTFLEWARALLPLAGGRV